MIGILHLGRKAGELVKDGGVAAAKTWASGRLVQVGAAGTPGRGSLSSAGPDPEPFSLTGLAGSWGQPAASQGSHTANGILHNSRA